MRSQRAEALPTSKPISAMQVSTESAAYQAPRSVGLKRSGSLGVAWTRLAPTNLASAPPAPVFRLQCATCTLLGEQRKLIFAVGGRDHGSFTQSRAWHQPYGAHKHPAHQGQVIPFVRTRCKARRRTDGVSGMSVPPPSIVACTGKSRSKTRKRFAGPGQRSVISSAKRRWRPLIYCPKSPVRALARSPSRSRRAR